MGGMLTVEELIIELQRAWNAGDADFVDVLGRVQKGREVIEAEHQKIFATIYRGSRLEIRLVAVRAISDEVLLVHTTSTLRVPAGPRAGDTHAAQTKIVKNGRITAFHNTVRTAMIDFAKRDRELADLSPLEWERSES